MDERDNDEFYTVFQLPTSVLYNDDYFNNLKKINAEKAKQISKDLDLRIKNKKILEKKEYLRLKKIYE